MSKSPPIPDYWYSRQPPPWHARALAALYAKVVALRLGLYRVGLLRRRTSPVPVIVVGNVTVGGTGKTPLTIALVKQLLAAGHSPGVASRGYGRGSKDAALWVEATTTTLQAGDEPVLIARETGVPVRVDRDRARAAAELAARGCDVVVCDDGLQHYRLARDIEIEVIDGQRRYGNGRLLPAGPLREPATRGGQCDFRVLNGGEAGFGEWPMRLQSGDARPMRGGRPRALVSFAGQRVHAVAGIGNPDRFFGMLRELGIGVVPHAFPDHHQYCGEDFEFASELPVLMTEKDAVKCGSFAGDHFYSVPVEARLPEAFWVALLDRLDKVKGHPDGP